MNRFDAALREHGTELVRDAPRVLQLNLGRACNIACTHCHVTAGPNRVESMSPEVAARCLDWIEERRPPVVDLTGGAPEMCTSFRTLMRGARRAGSKVLVRTNLVVLLEHGHEDLIDEFAELAVLVIASMPCYLEENVDRQRGPGVYARSVEALRRLNDVGFGRGDGLELHLVYNPGGSYLPPDQASLENDYRRELGDRHGVVFDSLMCLANLPVGRFGTQLRGSGELDAYVDRLEEAFNPATVSELMCRDTINVDHEGRVYDCDFNQMAGLPMGGRVGRDLWDLDSRRLRGRPVATASHCLGCTAGSGSSCAGALVR